MIGDEFALTQPGSARWSARPTGYRRWERSIVLGHGEELWRWASTEVLRWGIKTRSGFTVPGASRVTSGDRPVITARPFGLSIAEPVEVVAVVDTDDRVGFAYRTLTGHPVTGEEAFIVHRDGDGRVHLTIRSLTRPGDRWCWRAQYPVLLLAQAVARRRYARALRVRGGR